MHRKHPTNRPPTVGDNVHETDTGMRFLTAHLDFWIGNDQWNVNGFVIGVVKLFHQTVGNGLFSMSL